MTLINRKPDEFLLRSITVDETWVRHNRLEIKQQSKHCFFSDEYALKKAQMGLFVNTVMVTVVWDTLSITHIDYTNSVAGLMETWSRGKRLCSKTSQGHTNA